MTGQIVCVDVLEERDVEDSVNLHGGGEFEAVGVGADTFQDLEFPEPLVVHLGGPPVRVDVFSKDPDLASNFEM